MMKIKVNGKVDDITTITCSRPEEDQADVNITEKT